MSVLANLEPKEVFHYFEEICSIPHPSYREEQISNYLVDFAKKRNLKYYQDELKNVIIIKEAAKGYEQAEPLIIQGHMDMVCEKEPGCAIDFENDGLELKIEGDYITANGTTLGGDDGIAVAYALAILDSAVIEHPRIEFICTVSEEVGMEGASAVDISMLKGKKFLNIDSEDEGIMFTSCAGGCSAICTVPMQWEEKEGTQVDILISGLTGGHSGTEIDKGRANSNLLMGRILMHAAKHSTYQLISLGGGSKENAIPRETDAAILVTGDAVKLLDVLTQSAEEIQKEYAVNEPGMNVTIKALEKRGTKTLTADSTRKAVLLINELPNGIQTMSTDIEGLVETSLNLGILELREADLLLRYAVRSSVGSAKEYLMQKIVLLTEHLGGSVKRNGDYPAWEYRKDSPLREDAVRIYQEMYGEDPKIEAIHAGLECGILAGKIEDMDGISIGPDMTAVHTTEEKLSISSTRRVWEYLLELIKYKE